MPWTAIEHLEALRSCIGSMDTGELRGPCEEATEAYKQCDALEAILVPSTDEVKALITRLGWKNFFYHVADVANQESDVANPTVLQNGLAQTVEYLRHCGEIIDKSED